MKAALRPLIRRHQDGELFALVVAEPLARLVSGYLRGEPRLQLDEQLPCCGWERISIPPELLKNGSS